MHKSTTSRIFAILLVIGLPLLISASTSTGQAQPQQNPKSYSLFDIEATITWPVETGEDPVVTLHMTLTDLGINHLGFSYFRVEQKRGPKHHAYCSLLPDISGTEWSFDVITDPGYDTFMPGVVTVSYWAWFSASGSGLGDARVEERIILKPVKP